MTASLRFFSFSFACALATAGLAACTDGGGDSDTESAQSTGDSTSGGTTTGTTADTADTDAPTSGAPTTGDTATSDPGTTTDPGTTSDDTTTDDTGVGPALSWADDVYPVAIASNCSCHNLGSGGLTMTDSGDSYMNLVGVDSSEAPGFKRVAAGDPAGSYLVAKLKGVAGDPPFNGNPTQMPLGGTPLSADVIDLIEDWITQGALP